MAATQRTRPRRERGIHFQTLLLFMLWHLRTLRSHDEPEHSDHEKRAEPTWAKQWLNILRRWERAWAAAPSVLNPL